MRLDAILLAREILLECVRKPAQLLWQQSRIYVMLSSWYLNCELERNPTKPKGHTKFIGQPVVS